jgi:hypothetical protein
MIDAIRTSAARAEMMLIARRDDGHAVALLRLRQHCAAGQRDRRPRRSRLAF